MIGVFQIVSSKGKGKAAKDQNAAMGWDNKPTEHLEDLESRCRRRWNPFTEPGSRTAPLLLIDYEL